MMSRIRKFGTSSTFGAMLDFVDPDGIQLEFIFIDLEKLQRPAGVSYLSGLVLGLARSIG
jgi:hypothetical protein